jgi:ribosome-associated protein
MFDPDDPTSIAPGVTLAPGGYRLQFARSAGPGGQNVNKVNSRAELWVQVEALIGLSYRAKMRLRDLAGSRLTLNDEIHLRSEEQRSQETNRKAVFDRLRELIVAAKVEPKIRRKTKPSRGSKMRRLEGKRRRSEIKAGRRGHAE